MSTSWHSYGSIYNVGHTAAAELFDGPVTVEEKIDGSQFSFGVFDGEVKCRSKGQQLVVDAPEKLFFRAVQEVVARKSILHDGWTYRAEYLVKPKHNTLAYARHPKDHLVIFDIATAEECYLSHAEKSAEAERIGLEIVPLLFEGIVSNAEELKAFLTRDSFLGDQKLEGVVIKNYAKFGPDKKVLMGKYVSEAFREAHKVAWKIGNPQSRDVVQTIILALRTDARWIKAIGHLRDAGTLLGTPADIGPLLKEVQADIAKECEEEIKRALYEWAKPQVMRGVTSGLPEFYKNRLLESAFEDSPETMELPEAVSV
jgi:hypothetical protein